MIVAKLPCPLHLALHVARQDDELIGMTAGCVPKDKCKVCRSEQRTWSFIRFDSKDKANVTIQTYKVI